MKFETEIRKLYKKVNERNDKFKNKYDCECCNVYKVDFETIEKVEKENEAFLKEYANICKKHNKEISLPRGFKNRLFVIFKEKALIVRINKGFAVQSLLLKKDEIIEYMKFIFADYSNDKELLKKKMQEFELLDKKINKEFYRVHIDTGTTYKAKIQDKDFNLIAKTTIPKKSGLLVLKDAKVIEPDIRPRKQRKDRKKPVFVFYSLSVVE